MVKKKLSKKKIIIILILIIAVIGGIAFAMHQKKMKEAENMVYQQYTPLEKMDVLQEVKTSGKIQSTESENVTAATEGKIMKVFVEEGDMVTKGETLALLDTSTAEKAIADAKKQHKLDLEAAQAEIKTTKADYDVAKLSYQVGDISKIELNKSKNTYYTAKRNYNQKNAEFDLSKLNKDLRNCTITSPSDGTITMRKADVGNTSSGVMFSIENTNSLMISVKVNEYDVNSLKPGQKAIIKTEMTDEEEFEGVVTKVSPTAIKGEDGKTQTEGKAQFSVEIKIKNPSKSVRIGGNARASIILGGEKNVYAVTSDCLASDSQGNDIIFIVKKSGDKYVAQAIKVGIGVANDVYTQISSDKLKGGIKVLNNAAGLKDGQEILLG